MRKRWESKTRFYVAWIETDLLGDLVLMTVNGGRYNRLGHVASRYVGSIEEGQKALEEIGKMRLKHKYREVECH